MSHRQRMNEIVADLAARRQAEEIAEKTAVMKSFLAKIGLHRYSLVGRCVLQGLDDKESEANFQEAFFASDDRLAKNRAEAILPLQVDRARPDGSRQLRVIEYRLYRVCFDKPDPPNQDQEIYQLVLVQ